MSCTHSREGSPEMYGLFLLDEVEVGMDRQVGVGEALAKE
ncbi:hypothetical protein HGI09_06450 [Streptomyces collinus]|nr:hypothetical protein HGI10_57650 [Streptomyces collinus]UJA13350.1 hypothetical protein HGI09_06450 [Streptomyces collinus]